MKTYVVCLAAAISIPLLGATLPQKAQRAPRKPLVAPTFYIAVEASKCESGSIQFNGASNLPAGALIAVAVGDFDGDALTSFTDEIYVLINKDGFFDGQIKPRDGLRFRRNLILTADFMTYRPSQSKAVLTMVGPKGELLGGVQNPPLGELIGLSRNPQLFQTSGWHYGIREIARVPNYGEGVTGGAKN